MPRIFDNIELPLLPALRETLLISNRADFCVGYFSLRGWKLVDSIVEGWAGGESACARLLVGMQSLPHDELRASFRAQGPDGMDQQTAIRLKKRMAEEFRDQLSIGAPTNVDETGLRRLSQQIRERKLVVKLFLRHTLHAKLYLAYRKDPNSPTVGFLGSSNLTMPGLSKQGELNVDVLDHDACGKLQRWFEDRWADRWCLDISTELADLIDQSWARPDSIPPYHIYLKMAYHLSQEARAGLAEFRIPREFGNRLFPFQQAAVKIAAHHLNKRGGVLIGDVVGLGKTLMATALAKIFQDDHSTETLIICPKNLVTMWQGYVDRYRLLAKIVPITRVIGELPELRRYRVVLIDESHNLRNREGKRYRAIHEYVAENESRCILLSATPYNKAYTDLSSQLRLFVAEDRDLGIRPERLIREMGETEFIKQHQSPIRSLAAFEKSGYADDWRDLMRLFLVRRTRSFIQNNYATVDPSNGRKYLTFEDGSRSYFPVRVPTTIKFPIAEKDPDDPYARMFAAEVISAVNRLSLPRYGLGNYIRATPDSPPTASEAKVIQGLSRAGRRLMGFCRTNLFKRLESGGPAFLLSLERHVLRNFVYLHALDNGLDLPIGTQDADLLSDTDIESLVFEDDDQEDGTPPDANLESVKESDFRKEAARIYSEYSIRLKKRFRWLGPRHFAPKLGKDLLEDANAIIAVLHKCGSWQAGKDKKLAALIKLLEKTHAREKVLIFSQFADTVDYLTRELTARGVRHLEGVTGASENPTAIAVRFSPVSNEQKGVAGTERELRVLVTTDVLSEGQNLQDCAVIVNFDLPWAIIRLAQRAGRVDRIGQKATEIICYSFLPAEGVERIIQLRRRVRERLKENAEVVGTDEAFFEDEKNDSAILDLYHEKAGILESEGDAEVDLSSYAYQIWKNAIDADSALEKIVQDLPPVVYSAKSQRSSPEAPPGALVYVRTADGTDSLVWVDEHGKSVTQSQLRILETAASKPDEAAVPRSDEHHKLVQSALELVAAEEKRVGGELGRPSGARFRTYERLKRYLAQVGKRRDLFTTDVFVRSVEKAVDEIYRFTLRQSAVDVLNRQLKVGIDDPELARLVVSLRDENRLCIVEEEHQAQEPQILCSLGLREIGKG